VPTETKTRLIGGRSWSCTQMPPTMALEFETELAPLFLHAIVPLVSVIGRSDADQADVLGKAISAMTSALPPKDMASMITRLCNPELVFVDKSGVEFDKDFAGGEGVLLRYQVVWFVLETNFSDFFGALLPEGVIARAKAKFEENLGTSTGESGDPASQTLRSAS